MGDNAQGVLYDLDTNHSFMATFPLSAEELADYHKYPDTFFGVYQKQTGRVDTVIELFDFFFESFRETPKEKLLELIAGHPDHESLRNFSQKELAEILCERYVINVPAQGFAAKTPPSRRRGPGGTH